MKILYEIILFIIIIVLDRILYKIMRIISINSITKAIYFKIQDPDKRKILLENKEFMEYLYIKIRIISLCFVSFINTIIAIIIVYICNI